MCPLCLRERLYVLSSRNTFPLPFSHCMVSSTLCRYNYSIYSVHSSLWSHITYSKRESPVVRTWITMQLILKTNSLWHNGKKSVYLQFTKVHDTSWCVCKYRNQAKLSVKTIWAHHGDTKFPTQKCLCNPIFFPLFTLMLFQTYIHKQKLEFWRQF